LSVTYLCPIGTFIFISTCSGLCPNGNIGDIITIIYNFSSAAQRRISLTGTSRTVSVDPISTRNAPFSHSAMVCPPVNNGSTFQSRRKSAMKQAASTMANFLPRQDLGPMEKPRNDSKPFSHREGLNSCGEGKWRGFRSECKQGRSLFTTITNNSVK